MKKKSVNQQPYKSQITTPNFWTQKKASYLHHTATTVYLCCVPALEDSTGASCVGLADAKIQSLGYKTTIF